MKVSVVIPFYSNIQWLIEAVESVLNQTFQDFEIIVVNDGSTEDDKGFIEVYQSKIRYYKIQNRGPAFARNFGIEKATGEFIAFLDSDDLFATTKLERQVKLMEENSFIWSHTKYSVFDEVTDPKDRKFIEIDNEDFRGKVFPKCLTKLNIGTPCVMVRRDYLLAHKFIRFSENMRFGQDGYFWILMGINCDLGYINENLTYVRRSGSNAVQRARVHLNVRSNLNKNLISKIKDFYPDVKISRFTLFIYKYCEFADNIVLSVFGSNNFKNSKAEIMSKILYAPAFFMFKMVNS